MSNRVFAAAAIVAEMGELMTFAETHSNPSTLWLGIDDRTHAPEGALQADLPASPNIAELDPDLAVGHRYELLAPDRHRAFGSKFITTFDFRDEQSAQGWTAQKERLFDSSALPALPTGLAVQWALLYRYLTETGPSLVRPYAIYVVGVDPPSGMDASELAEFNEFYTNVHVPEVVRRRHCLRATRYELDRELLHPHEGSPQFLAVYEVDERAARVTSHVGGGYSRGPAVWNRHTTPWRLWYRQLPD